MASHCRRMLTLARCPVQWQTIIVDSSKCSSYSESACIYKFQCINNNVTVLAADMSSLSWLFLIKSCHASCCMFTPAASLQNLRHFIFHFQLPVSLSIIYLLTVRVIIISSQVLQSKQMFTDFSFSVFAFSFSSSAYSKSSCHIYPSLLHLLQWE